MEIDETRMMQSSLQSQIHPRRSLGQASHPNGRPAADLSEAAQASLGQSGYAALSYICCDVHGDHVTLQGRLPTYHLKQLAQECVQRVVGVGRVVNEIAVGWPLDQRPSS